MEHKCLLSFIIPVYNRKHILPRAMNSILNSSFCDYEIILVDDGSTDGSAELCKRYETNDTQFKAICLSENHGPGYARNKGLEIATGQWVYFLDSDDEIITDSLQRVAKKLYSLSDDISLVVVDSIWIQRNKDRSEQLYMPKLFDTDGLYTAERFFHDNPMLIGAQVWNYIYRRKDICRRKIRFPIIYNHEDMLFNLRYMQNVKSIYVLSNILVKYCKLTQDSLFSKLDHIHCKKDMYAIVSPFVEMCKLYIAYNEGLKECLFQKMRYHVLFYGIQVRCKYADIAPDHLNEYIWRLSNEAEKKNQIELFEKIYSIFFNQLLKEAIYIIPAGKNQRILAQNLIAHGGKVLGMFDNYLGRINGRVIEDTPNVKIYSLEYINSAAYVDGKIINLATGKLSSILKKQFEKYGVELF